MGAAPFSYISWWHWGVAGERKGRVSRKAQVGLEPHGHQGVTQQPLKAGSYYKSKKGHMRLGARACWRSIESATLPSRAWDRRRSLCCRAKCSRPAANNVTKILQKRISIFAACLQKKRESAKFSTNSVEKNIMIVKVALLQMRYEDEIIGLTDNSFTNYTALIPRALSGLREQFIGKK